MKTHRTLPALLLALILAVGLTAAASAASGYTDVAGTWSEAYVSRVTELGLMDGRTAETFAPNDNMTAWRVPPP